MKPGKKRRKKLGKRIGADVGWAVMRLTETLVRWRGTGYALRLGRGAARVFWSLLVTFARRRMRLSLANAKVIMPDATARERRRAVKSAFVDTVSFWPELVNYAHARRKCKVLESVTVEGREHLDAALAGGKGVVAVSVHLGNFPLIGIWMAQAGYDFHYLSRFPHDERVQKRFAFLRGLSGVRVIRDHPRRKCAVDCVRTLRRNGIIYFQLDQRAMISMAGVNVDFFGLPFHAFSGTMSLARKTGAALVPIYIVREQGVRQRIVIDPEMPFERTGDKLAETRANLQRIMKRFEKWIRAHPDQYWWFNRKWEGVE